MCLDESNDSTQTKNDQVVQAVDHKGTHIGTYLHTPEKLRPPLGRRSKV